MSEAEDALKRAEELLARLEEVRGELEATEDPEKAIDMLTELSRIAKDVDYELNRAKRAADADA
jgi:hypothetical protein